MGIVITTYGKILSGWNRKNGPVVVDRDNKYRVTFSIAVPYNAVQKEQFARMRELKRLLEQTDYKTLKHSEGEISEEEWEKAKAERAAWRAEINEIQKSFVEPTISREEIDEAERKAMEVLKSHMPKADEIESIEGAEE